MSRLRVRLPGEAGEGVRLAMETLRLNRLRASLAILGIAIGIFTIVLMTTVIGGMRVAVLAEFERAGAHNFRIMRWPQGELLVAESDIYSNPRITLEDVARVSRLPSVRAASARVYAPASAQYRSARIGSLPVFGLGAEWPVWQSGVFMAGRNFLPVEVERRTAVVVLSTDAASALLGHTEYDEILGETVQVGAAGFVVVGVFEEGLVLGIDSGPSAWAPVTSVLKLLDARDDFLWVEVVPADELSSAVAIDDVVATMRVERRLRPSEADNFFIQSNRAATDSFERWSGLLLAVMVLLSSIGLLVGGVGVVAIMMISVTERTREIGIRRALGATRRGILWQFIAEAVTITLVGGATGLLMGLTGAGLVRWLTPLPAFVSVGGVLAALATAAVCGIGFGFYPALKAAHLDPALAIRHE